MIKKKIIIISAQFFPHNSPRSNRTLELSKEFARQGHEVTVFSVLGSYDYSEFEKLSGVFVRNLGKMRFSTFTSDITGRKPSFLTLVLAKLFYKYTDFPDIELAYHTYKVLKNNSKNYDLLISVAYPFAIHWGCAFAKNKVKYFPNTWVADCGDPYMGNPDLGKPFYFKYIEKYFCRKIDYITIPTPKAINGYYPEFHDKINIIPQGFNFSEYKNLPLYKKNKVPTFVYAGAFYKSIRDPSPFLKYLIGIKKEFRFIVYTNQKKFLLPFQEKLGSKLEIRDVLPRKEVLKILTQADFLVNFQNKESVQTPSKLIDYIIVNRPVLNIHTSHDFPKVINFLESDYKYKMDLPNKKTYDISNIANKFLNLNN